ncbi:unnamed protein product, partial [Oppiella nova]
MTDMAVEAAVVEDMVEAVVPEDMVGAAMMEVMVAAEEEVVMMEKEVMVAEGMEALAVEAAAPVVEAMVAEVQEVVVVMEARVAVELEVMVAQVAEELVMEAEVPAVEAMEALVVEAAEVRVAEPEVMEVLAVEEPAVTAAEVPALGAVEVMAAPVVEAVVTEVGVPAVEPMEAKVQEAVAMEGQAVEEPAVTAAEVPALGAVMEALEEAELEVMVGEVQEAAATGVEVLVVEPVVMEGAVQAVVVTEEEEVVPEAGVMEVPAVEPVVTEAEVQVAEPVVMEGAVQVEEAMEAEVPGAEAEDTEEEVVVKKLLFLAVISVDERPINTKVPLNTSTAPQMVVNWETMFVIRGHHKQAINKLIHCITNTATSVPSIVTQHNVPHIDHKIFTRLTQIVSVYESVVNSTDHQFAAQELAEDHNKAFDAIRQWLLANYSCHELLDQLFIDCTPRDTSMDPLSGDSDDGVEDKLWTMTLLVLNVMYKMRNCMSEHKMMLELGWICLSELDASLEHMKPNYNQMLAVLQTALNEEKKDNKPDAEECLQLQHEVKRLRQKIIDLQRNVIQVNKEKQLLAKRDNASASGAKQLKPQKRMTQNSLKRALNCQIETIVDDDLQTPHKRGRKPNAAIAGNGDYNCDICNKPFGSAYRLNRHMYSHTGERPYSCLWPACHRQF